jgi:hypothetical protein
MKFTPMIENEYCTVLVIIALYEGGAEQSESNVVREEEDGLSTPDTTRQKWHARSRQ